MVLSDFLNIGQIWAILKIEGKTPSVRDLLISVLIGGIKKALNSLRRVVGMLLGPDALLIPKLEIIARISLSSHGCASN